MFIVYKWWNGKNNGVWTVKIVCEMYSASTIAENEQIEDLNCFRYILKAIIICISKSSGIEISMIRPTKTTVI